MIDSENITEDHLYLMHCIQNDSNASQRQLSQKIGFSIGKVNYCLKALINIGFIKVCNSNKQNKKISCSYILTPKGIKQKVAITKQFINKKKQEYKELNSYIDS